jgi:hypothetical protein
MIDMMNRPCDAQADEAGTGRRVGRGAAVNGEGQRYQAVAGSMAMPLMGRGERELTEGVGVAGAASSLADTGRPGGTPLF